VPIWSNTGFANLGNSNAGFWDSGDVNTGAGSTGSHGGSSGFGTRARATPASSTRAITTQGWAIRRPWAITRASSTRAQVNTTPRNPMPSSTFDTTATTEGWRPLAGRSCRSRDRMQRRCRCRRPCRCRGRYVCLAAGQSQNCGEQEGGKPLACSGCVFGVGHSAEQFRGIIGTMMHTLRRRR